MPFIHSSFQPGSNCITNKAKYVQKSTLADAIATHKNVEWAQLNINVCKAPEILYLHSSYHFSSRQSVRSRQMVPCGLDTEHLIALLQCRIQRRTIVQQNPFSDRQRQAAVLDQVVV